MKFMKYNLMLLFSIILMPFVSNAQDMSTYQRKQFITKTDTLPYRILLPENFDESKKYPVILVLHGAGERGDNNEAQLVHGSDLFLKDDVRNKFPAIILFPQCPADSYWSNVDVVPNGNSRDFNFRTNGEPTAAMEMLLKFVKDFKKKDYVDDDRFYVGGLSMGGMGTLEILRRTKNTFAAAFSICGGDNPENAKKYRKTPIWFFHGGKDDVVPPINSEKVVNALKKYGDEVKFTLYPEANHNSWDQTFAEPELLPWLFSHKR